MPTKLTIASGLQDFQILQQNNGYADLTISGAFVMSDPSLTVEKVYARIMAEDNGSVIIPWTECQIYEKGKWKLTFKDIPAGGLYRVETSMDHSKAQKIRGDMIHHVGVGDIFVIAGQSNAAGYGKDSAYDPPEIGIHAFKNSGKWDLASHPLSDSTGSEFAENRDIGVPGHSPYICFARVLKKELGYPIGLIPTALGGSSLSRWNPDEDGTLYRNMLKRVISAGGKVKAMLWYQGCADADGNSADTYLTRFTGMVNHVRQDFNNENLPVFTVQINRFVVPASDSNDRSWGRIRESQRQAAAKIPFVFIVPASDCTLSDAIHNSARANLMLGERLAKSALFNIYGKKYFSEAPNVSKVKKVAKTRIQLTFDNVIGQLYAYEVGPEKIPFTVEDENGRLEIKGYEINRDEIILDTDREPGRECVIHGVWEQNPPFFAPIDNISYLPILSFYGLSLE